MDEVSNALLIVYFAASGSFALYFLSASDKPYSKQYTMALFGFGLILRVSTLRHPGSPMHEILATAGCGCFLVIAWIWLAKLKPDSKRPGR